MDERGAQRAFAGARRARQDKGAAAAFDGCGMNDEIVMRADADRPVETPFEHRQGMMRRARLECRSAVENEFERRPEPAPQRRIADGDVKIAERRIVDKAACVIEQRQPLRDARIGGLDMRDERAGFEMVGSRLHGRMRFTRCGS